MKKIKFFNIIILISIIFILNIYSYQWPIDGEVKVCGNFGTYEKMNQEALGLPLGQKRS